MLPADIVQMALFTASAALLLLCFTLSGLVFLHTRRGRLTSEIMSGLIASDAIASVVTNAQGEVLSLNSAAQARFGQDTDTTVGFNALLEKTLANPSAITFRLKSKSNEAGAAREDIVTRHGHLRLSVHKTARDFYLWRVEDITPAASASEGPVLPMLIIGRGDTVLHMNDAARKLAGGRVKSLDQLFRAPVVPGTFCDLTVAEGTVRAFVSEVDAGAGRRALFLVHTDDAKAGDGNWSVFQNLPVPLLKISPDGHVDAFNLMAANMVGVTLDNGVHLSEFMEGLGRPITDWLKETLAGRATQQTEFLRLKRMDKEVFVQVTLNKVTENGMPALIAVCNDATELKSLEAQFVQSQKMQAIGQLAGGVAHDFNNLLTAISGHCDLLLLRHDQGDPDFSDLVQINQNANRAAALVGQLLAFSRKQTLRPETLDMRDTLADLTHLLNRLVGEKVTLTLSHDPVLLPIRADKRQLEQVLMNLVVNARDAMPSGGEIRIDTQCTLLKEPLTRDRVTVPAGQYVTVRVSDEGVGIPSDKLQKVFEPFYTTKRTGEGTGLGLSTAYGIIKQTGGYIFVDSTIGHGTCFTLYFPVLDHEIQAPKKVPKEATKVQSKRGDGVILLVEDEAPVRAFASRALRLRGYTVLEADSAESALKTLEDQSLSVDVFVTDVVMPGMDGPSWVRKALKTRPDVRVVFVSGYAEDSFGEAQMKIPNSVFLPKPFSLNDLTETVHQQLH
ncbi:MAG: ATP-binding protein [Roseobacter sp.]|nr:ATP-binding protein [Roseobacter sp.]